MIDTTKIDFDALAEIVSAVQAREKYQFDLHEVTQVIQHTVRKADLNHKAESYIPILFENELRDHVMRERINEMGRKCLCARSVIAAPA